MVMPLLIHGDAAFAGQGVIAECFGLSGLKGHRTGGSVHFIINNQIGFTTYPRYSRSSPYPSDVAKMIEAPIFHVNGDDPEAVVFAAKVATEFRQKFHKPVVIDMFCYRRFGHNEGDEPAFTQPLMYKAIATHPTTLEIYTARSWSREGVVTAGEVEKMKADWRARLDAELEAGAAGYNANKADWLDGRWAGFRAGRRRRRCAPRQDRRRSSRSSRRSAQKITTRAGGFSSAQTLQRFLDNRRKAIETGAGIDWATGEALAFCSLLLEGHPVRLSGQDSERGTFSQRHSRADRSGDRERATRRSTISRDGQARYEVINSMLSEEAVLGFEYGYSLAEPNALTHVGSAVRRFRQWRAGGVRSVHLVRRTQMAAHVGPRLPAAAWLRGPGTGAFLGAARALSADVRRGQYAGRQLHDAGELLPHPAPAAEARLPQAADPDDAEIAAAPQARGVAARRDWAPTRRSTACCGTTRRCCRARRSSSSPTTRSAASSSARARSITISTRSARSAASTTSICCASSSSIRSRSRR